LKIACSAATTASFAVRTTRQVKVRRDGEPSLYALLAGDKMTFQKLKADVGANFAAKTASLPRHCSARPTARSGLRPLVEPYLSHTDEAIRAHAAWCLIGSREGLLGA
jgi:hypothetical protein